MLPFEHLIIIDKESKVPVYRQIAIAFINAIKNGTLKAGTQLPGSRALAKTLGVHRKTVIAGYEELDAQDWIQIIPRKPIRVSTHIPMLTPQKWNHSNAKVAYEMDLKLPFRLIEKNRADHHSFVSPEIVIDDGHPDVRISPINALLKTYRSLTSRRYAIKSANTGTTQGTLPFREELMRYLSITRGLNITVGNILITHGAQMSIYLAAQLLLGRSTHIIVGVPNYPLANKTFKETGAQVIEVNVDEKGIDTEAIEKLCKRKKIDAVYVIPHHHYPTTVTLSAERRVKLLALSKQYSFVIIEDDYDYDYHYTSAPYLPLASGNHEGNVIYIGSFSKILDPSLRIGFMVAPQNFIDQCTALRKIIDVSGDGYMQNALAALIRDGELQRHLKKAKKCYHQRRDYLDQLLRNNLDGMISYTLPTGGMAVWIQLRPDIPISLLATHKELKIIRYEEKLNAFRFGFASMNEIELTQAVTLIKSMITMKK